MSYSVCPFCGHDYRVAVGPPGPTRSAKPMVAGALMAVAGLLAILMGAILLTVDASYLMELGYSPSSEYDFSIQELLDVAVVCAAFVIVAGTIAVIGSIFALTRKHFPLAVLGGIFAIAGVGFILGAILGLAALILIAVSRSEF